MGDGTPDGCFVPMPVIIPNYKTICLKKIQVVLRKRNSRSKNNKPRLNYIFSPSQECDLKLVWNLLVNTSEVICQVRPLWPFPGRRCPYLKQCILSFATDFLVPSSFCLEKPSILYNLSEYLSTYQMGCCPILEFTWLNSCLLTVGM